ncbi:hypothetical protein C3B54_111580 [Pontimonas salivibrio]|uniref:Uncharacterized protein n=1 Tax=Pontimonas salivibrio TaxID=1159327 RepID=A0A2L2BSA8_9MICO|nr:hypothetical protein [Pontimonas salivibrio]AVG24517.1 hypothetical protein C3B54_111580 [Pontimonas salivibrio]
MRRFLFSSSVISAVASGAGLLRQTIKNPWSWRTALLWISWVISVVLAVTSVIDRGRLPDDITQGTR